MKTAPRGKWFIRATEVESGKRFTPFYDGFGTKKEAQEICEKLNKETPNVTHEVMRKGEKL